MVQTHIHTAKSYAQFFKYASETCSFIYGKDRNHPNGKAALLELSRSSDLVKQIESTRNGAPLQFSRPIVTAMSSSLDGGVRTLAVLSYDRLIGYITVRSSVSTLHLDMAKMRIFSHHTHEQINQWRSAVSTLADQYAAA